MKTRVNGFIIGDLIVHKLDNFELSPLRNITNNKTYVILNITNRGGETKSDLVTIVDDIGRTTHLDELWFHPTPIRTEMGVYLYG